MNFLLRVLVSALALGAAAWLFDGIEVIGEDAAEQRSRCSGWPSSSASSTRSWRRW